MEHLHNDELLQRLVNAQRERSQAELERDALCVENTELLRRIEAQARRINELDAALGRRRMQYLELKAVLDLRQELGTPDAVRGFYSSPEGPS